MQVDQVIAGYFEGIYKRPDHMKQHLATSVTQNDEMADESTNKSAIFSLDDIKLATKSSNFNKGLGPDCFDGNLLTKNVLLGDKMM